MKLNLNFVNKVPKIAKDNEIILLTKKVIKNKVIKKLSKSVFSNKLFSEQNFLAKDFNDKSYIFVNCSKSKKISVILFSRDNLRLITFSSD